MLWAMPSVAILPTLLRESLGGRALSREPEPDLVMDGASQVSDYSIAGRIPGVMAAAYLFHTAHVCQTIFGCSRVFDLGCGPATQLVQVAKRNPQTSFVGIDLSEPMLEAARAYALAEGCANVEFRQGDITKLDAVDGSVDGIISTMALHHLPTTELLRGCFREITRVLRADGAVYLVDFGLLKSLRSIMFFVNQNRPHQAAHFSLDFELSMKAAFPPGQLRALTEELLPHHVQFYSTFQVPLLNIVKSKDRPLSPTLYSHFRETRKALPIIFRRQLDDMRAFFWFGGLRNDPFRNRVRT